MQTKYSLSSKLNQIKNKIGILIEDNKYYLQRINSLTDALAGAVNLPDISEYLTQRTLVKPYDFIRGYNLQYADIAYYALPKENWEKILTPIQSKVKTCLQEWRTNISDCDDWALTMSSFVALAFLKSRTKSYLDHQGAFAIAWSVVHAYNAYIASDGKVYIYEPQSNRTIGELGKTSEPYNTQMLWFMS